MLNVRTNILFDRQMWQQLTYLAKSQSTSVGSLVRNAVKKTYVDDTVQRQRAAAIDEIRRIRPHLKNVNYKELINYGRKY